MNGPSCDRTGSITRAREVASVAGRDLARVERVAARAGVLVLDTSKREALLRTRVQALLDRQRVVGRRATGEQALAVRLRRAPDALPAVDLLKPADGGRGQGLGGSTAASAGRSATGAGLYGVAAREFVEP